MAAGQRARLVIKVSQVPDWGRRAIRLSLALTFFTTLALTLWPVPEALREEWGDEVRQTCNWAGASCAVVAASPLIGKVAQLSYERTLGTLTGGLLGFMVYDYGVMMLSETAADVLMVVSVAAVGFASCWLSQRFSLDASMRLFVITFLIVMFGGGTHSALGVALLRTGGILLGVLLFMGLTVIILPKSATIESLREMKNGLKLLTELNTLVWTSKQEAEAAMKDAAAKARAAELNAAAAAAAVAATAAATASGKAPAPAPSGARGGGGAGPPPVQRRSLPEVLLGWFGGPKGGGRRGAGPQGQVQVGYQPLPGADPEAGTAGWGPGAGGGTTTTMTSTSTTTNTQQHQQQPGGGSKVSQLTRALQQGGGARGSSSSGHHGQAAVGQQGSGQALQAQQQGSGQGQQTYAAFMRGYEERCEGVLTSVYQSMFKVKEHAQLAESEAYIWHFAGHYVFLPVFFSRALMAWLLPNRWVLPKAKLERLSTSIRVLARLLWTVHLDYSQEAFDEVLQALPPAANGWGNLLLELGEAVSAALGVLVEAFPNKAVVLVDRLTALDAKVDQMLEICGDQRHDDLIRELAAKRPKAGGAARTASAGGGPIAGGPAPVAGTPFANGTAAGSSGIGVGVGAAAAAPLSPRCSGTPHDTGARPGAAAVASAAAGLGRSRFGGAAAAVRLGLEWQAASAGDSGDTPHHTVPFVTYDDEDEEDEEGPEGGSVDETTGLHGSWAAEQLGGSGLAPPEPAESPVLGSSAPPTPEGAAATAGAGAGAGPASASLPKQQQQQQQQQHVAARSQGLALAAQSAPSQGELMFDLADLGAPPAAAAAAAAADGASSSSSLGAAGAAPAGSGRLSDGQPATQAGARGPPLRWSTMQRPAAQGPLPSSLVRSHFAPLAVVAAVKLSKRVHTARAAAGAAAAPSAERSPGSATSAAQHAAQLQQAAVAALGAEGALEALACMRTHSTPDPAVADAAAALLQQQPQPQPLPPQQQQQQQQQQQADVAGGQGGGSGSVQGTSLMLPALQDPDTRGMVTLTRWYSLQFLMMEILEEVHELYYCVRDVLQTLPHGL